MAHYGSNIRGKMFDYKAPIVEINALKPKRERERVRKDSIRVEVKRKHLGESERRFI
jgi:hypothetical protein